jgi:hypothetical protein
MDGGRKCEYGEGRKKKKNEEDCGKVRNVRSPGQDNGVGVGEALKKSPMG